MSQEPGRAVSHDPSHDPRVLEPWARDLLRCPVTGATLVDGVGPDGEPTLVSTDRDNPLAYPVRDGIPVLLVDEGIPVSRS